MSYTVDNQILSKIIIDAVYLFVPMILTALWNYFLARFEKKKLTGLNVCILLIGCFFLSLLVSIFWKVAPIFVDGFNRKVTYFSFSFFIFVFIIFEGTYYLWLKNKIDFKNLAIFKIIKMKQTILIYIGLIFCVIILSACKNRSSDRLTIISEKTVPKEHKQNEKENSKEIQASINNGPIDSIRGDFNGDGVIDSMWLERPKIVGKGMDRIEDCICYIRFSDPAIPSILIKDCIDGIPDNVGDLNKNGTDEIGLLPGWFSSCWREYLVWTFLNGKWEFAVKPFLTYCNQWLDDVKPIEIDKNKEGNVIIRYTDLTVVSDYAVKTKSVKIKK